MFFGLSYQNNLVLQLYTQLTLSPQSESCLQAILGMGNFDTGTNQKCDIISFILVKYKNKKGILGYKLLSLGI